MLHLDFTYTNLYSFTEFAVIKEGRSLLKLKKKSLDFGTEAFSLEICI